MPRPLPDQVAVVTGASSGVGRETALLLAEHGASVVLAARNEEALRTLEAEVTRLGGTALVRPTDVSDWSQVAGLAQDTVERFGRIDTWVNCAASAVYGDLLHAEFQRDGIDYRYWRRVGRARRLDKVDGEPKRWDLAKSVKERWIDAKQPVRANLNFFISLRNKVEHRYARQQQALATVVGGQAQALLLNYEEELTSKFGSCVSLATRLRFPVFIGSFTSEGEQTLRRLRKSLPLTLRTFIAEYEAGLDDAVTTDPRYELRLRVLQELAPKDPDALAVQFTRYDDLTEEQRETVEAIGRKGLVVVRERKRAVVGHGLKKPKQVVAEVAASIPFVFTMGHFTKAWKLYEIRPPAGAKHPERTLEQYCLYDERHDDYGYKQAYISRLIRECSSEEGFREYLKAPPRDKITGEWVGEPPLSATPPWKRTPPDDDQTPLDQAG